MSPDKEERSQERLESHPYYVAARYPSDKASEKPYRQTRNYLYAHEDVQLSVFRFQLGRQGSNRLDWHVAVVGMQPEAHHEREVRRRLQAGQAVTLPEEVVGAMYRRRVEASRQGPWVERHHKPGRRLK
ncbi:MAG: hypothetical protein M3R24_26095 [Chloroflexota bacterium]|nr:hypothetical protein [Chloroflexota bacterium]